MKHMDRIADFVILMTYEWGWRGGPPQAVSPMKWNEKVLDYAVSEIPRDKILMGFQIYARDWILPHVRGQIAETFSMQEAIARAVKYGVAIRYDEVSQSPFFITQMSKEELMKCGLKMLEVLKLNLI